MKLTPIIREMERLVRAGQGLEAQRRLRKLRGIRTLGAARASLASLAWRAGMPELGLQMLGTPLKAGGEYRVGGSTAEKAEYAQCLIRVGAVEEGSALLDALSHREEPRVLLYRASARISQWDYGSALPLLREYLKLMAPGSYSLFVGRTNLAAVYAFLKDYRRSEAMFRELAHETSVRKWSLLYGACMELAAQTFLDQAKWSEFARCLDAAETSLRDMGTNDSFWVQKWRIIGAFVRKKGRDGQERVLRELKIECAARRQWEAIRQIDVYRATVLGDSSLMRHLVFGSPYPGLRSQMLREFGRPLDLPRLYEWRLGDGKGPAPALDLVTGRLRVGHSTSPAFKPGRLVHRFLLALASDFYRPLRIGALHSRLSPQEQFNPLVTPHRMHESARYFRKWLAASRLPLRLLNTAEGYRLSPIKVCELLVPHPETRLGRSDVQALQLRKIFSSGEFTAAEAGRECGVSGRTMRRLLDEFYKKGDVVRVGRGRSTRYRLAS